MSGMFYILSIRSTTKLVRQHCV